MERDDAPNGAGASTGTDWNFAQVWDLVAEVTPNADAIVTSAATLSWAQFERNAEQLAYALAQVGLRPGARFAQYLVNCPEYLIGVYAAFKARLVPVNTNYRYTGDELANIWEDSDSEAVMFHGRFTARVEEVRSRMPGVRLWIHVEDGTTPCPVWAIGLTSILAGFTGSLRPGSRDNRSGDDRVFIYTGGTTGAPKGVIWRQDDLFVLLNRSASLRFQLAEGPAAARTVLAAPRRWPPERTVVVPPMMHGSALLIALSTLSTGGCVLLPPGTALDTTAVLDLAQTEHASHLLVVGDAVSRPLIDALDGTPGRWSLDSLRVIMSSGMAWSQPARERLLAHIPQALLIDMLGSSEIVGVASSRSSRKGIEPVGVFRPGADTMVVDEKGQRLEPGHVGTGLLAIRGRGPMGYHKDPTASSATFRIIDGSRWTVPGDWAQLETDGSITLLGRGSTCINTGGEKVFPEEVERVIKADRAVADAAVVGIPDERFGEVVAALVEPVQGQEIDRGRLEQAARRVLAGYKVPKHWLTVDSIGRAPNSKIDYRALQAHARQALRSEVLP